MGVVTTVTTTISNESAAHAAVRGRCDDANLSLLCITMSTTSYYGDPAGDVALAEVPGEGPTDVFAHTYLHGDFTIWQAGTTDSVSVVSAWGARF